MSIFWTNAQKLLHAAVDAAIAGGHTESMTVVVGVEGGIHLLANNDWSLDRLAAERGATMVYRVTNAHGSIDVVGQNGADRCHLTTQAPAKLFESILRDEPRYTVD